MSRIALIHWNAGEADERAQVLARCGHTVRCTSDPRANPGALLSDVPDAFVIDLSRLPSQGRELGGYLRRACATRCTPLVFVVGEPSRAERARQLLPDAVFTTWDRIAGDLAGALASPPATPSVPGAMDAYLGAPLAKKLGLKESSSLLLVDAPTGFENALAPLPAFAQVGRWAEHPVDIVLSFCNSPDNLGARFDDAASNVREGGRLWILWRKAVGRGAPRVTLTAVRSLGLARGWVDYKICAVDATWSGLCFARRMGGER